jgi:hypothetical protein
MLLHLNLLLWTDVEIKPECKSNMCVFYEEELEQCYDTHIQQQK